MSPEKYLVIRFSAMGDVAIASPLVKSIIDRNEGIEIQFLSKPFYEPLFENREGFSFLGPDLKGKHKGFIGLYRLYKELKKYKFKAVIDLHSSLRSRIIGFLFRLSGTPVYTIDKGRAEKRQLLKRGAIHCPPLPHSIVRYAKVFQKAGLKWEFDKMVLPTLGRSSESILDLIKEKGNDKWIGIAPFAAHSSKEWPVDRVRKLCEQLREEGNKILWFGAGEREISIIKNYLQQTEDHIIAGKFSLEEELFLMRQIDLMICMDSANMHMAAISGIPVVSIWGPTHPHAGFSPLKNREGIVQVEMEGRPCSIYGRLKDAKAAEVAHKSMDAITIAMVLAKVHAAFRRRSPGP
ncbi:MAG: glycosyltransferase family 9 protein [Saprospirales bacterium]|nr:MAG: glycosyltransferase family 9 protein [Saprospirales bacterium]